MGIQKKPRNPQTRPPRRIIARPLDDAQLMSLLDETDVPNMPLPTTECRSDTKTGKSNTRSLKKSGPAERRVGVVVHAGRMVEPTGMQDEASEGRIREAGELSPAAARLAVEEEARRLITPRLPAALASVAQRCIDTGDPRALDGTLRAMGWRSPDDGERESEHWARAMDWHAGGYEAFAGLPQLQLSADEMDDPPGGIRGIIVAG